MASSGLFAEALDLQKKETGGIGLTPDYLSFRNTYWGQSQPVNYQILKKAYLEDPIIYRCINVTTNAILAYGYRLKGGSVRNRKRILNVLMRGQFQKVLRDMVIQLLVYGDAYLEVTRDSDKKIIDFFPHDASTIRVDYNEHGEAIKYIQRVLHRRVDFYPDEMIHFSLNNWGGRVYGHSVLTPILDTLQTKQYAESYTADFFRRGAVPRIVYILKNYSKEQAERFVDKMKNVKPQQDLALVGDVEPKELGLNSNTDLQFHELLNYLRENIVAALGVPPIYLGLIQGGARGNAATTQLEAFDDSVAALKSQIADALNTEFFTNKNFVVDCTFEFDENNSRERLRKAQIAQLMSTTMGAFTEDEIRHELQLPPKRAISESWGISPESQGEDVEMVNVPPEVLNPQQAQGTADPRTPGIQHTNIPVDRPDNARANNSERASETKKSVTTNTDTPLRPYPLGAVPVEIQRISERAKTKIEEQKREVRLTATNPITNALDLNTDRIYPRGDEKNPEKGETPVGTPLESPKNRRYRDQERDNPEARA